ncbi:hypothetical protein ABH933_005158 [Nocardia sp. GP40]
MLSLRLHLGVLHPAMTQRDVHVVAQALADAVG